MMKFNFKPSGATPKIGLVLLQVPSNISPTSEFKETKVGDELVQIGWASKRAKGDLGTEADGGGGQGDIGSFFLGEILCEQRVVAMSFFLGFFISGVVL